MGVYISVEPGDFSLTVPCLLPVTDFTVAWLSGDLQRVVLLFKC